MNICEEIVELFEDFLEKRGVNIPNEDRDADGDPDAAIIYGIDYAELCDSVEELLTKWMAGTIDKFLRKAVTER